MLSKKFQQKTSNFVIFGLDFHIPYLLHYLSMYFLPFYKIRNTANLKLFCQNFTLRTNPKIGRSDLFIACLCKQQIQKYLAGCLICQTTLLHVLDKNTILLNAETRYYLFQSKLLSHIQFFQLLNYIESESTDKIIIDLGM